MDAPLLLVWMILLRYGGWGRRSWGFGGMELCGYEVISDDVQTAAVRGAIESLIQPEYGTHWIVSDVLRDIPRTRKSLRR